MEQLNKKKYIMATDTNVTINHWKQCLLRGPSRGYIIRASGENQPSAGHNSECQPEAIRSWKSGVGGL
jgi:hypothetical protein